MKRRIVTLFLALSLLAALGTLSGCADSNAKMEDLYLQPTVLEEVDLEDEAVALAGLPAIPNLLLPEHPGTLAVSNAKAEVDYSNAKDGYVMVRYTAATDRRLKVMVTGPVTEGGYQYNLTQGEWTTFPLSDGSGNYTVKVYEQNPASGKYAVMLSASLNAQLTDEFAPFLRPNQYVNYEGAVNTLAKAEELTEGLTSPLEKVAEIYDFVVGNLSYDVQRAKTVKSGYLPVLDSVLEEKKGICFDYAALMTAMLRAEDVPCKLVVGYVDTGAGNPAYHAWISVWTEEQGWIDGAIYFDGAAWQRMDPTFASSGKGSKTVMKLIGNGENYTVRYLY